MSLSEVTLVEMLVRATEAGSFAKAARSLNLTPSAVSHAVAALERELRVALFYRTTRKLQLNEEGEELYRRGRGWLDGSPVASIHAPLGGQGVGAE